MAAVISPPRPASLALGVVQPDKIETLTNVGRTEARRAQIDRPPGVMRSFHVSRYKVEPSKSVFARNLLANDDRKAALSDDVVERRP